MLEEAWETGLSGKPAEEDVTLEVKAKGRATHVKREGERDESAGPRATAPRQQGPRCQRAGWRPERQEAAGRGKRRAQRGCPGRDAKASSRVWSPS